MMRTFNSSIVISTAGRSPLSSLEISLWGCFSSSPIPFTRSHKHIHFALPIHRLKSKKLLAAPCLGISTYIYIKETSFYCVVRQRILHHLKFFSSSLEINTPELKILHSAPRLSIDTPQL